MRHNTIIRIPHLTSFLSQVGVPEVEKGINYVLQV